MKWLMTEGFKYHTTVSLHINMFDAYADSPLWDTYVKNGIIAKDEKGGLLKGEVQGPKGQDPRIDTQSYYISYAKEWETGWPKSESMGFWPCFRSRRQARFISTLFISIVRSRTLIRRRSIRDLAKSDKPISPYLNIPVEKETEAQRKIYRYFRDKGIDVTSEGTKFLAQTPMSGSSRWHGTMVRRPVAYCPASTAGRRCEPSRRLLKIP